MEHIRADTQTGVTHPRAECSFGEPSFVEALIDPVKVFRHPREVTEHPRFTDGEKRTILLSWARDELVLEQVARKVMPEIRPRSRIDEVVEALASFDSGAASEYRSAVDAVRHDAQGGSRDHLH